MVIQFGNTVLQSEKPPCWVQTWRFFRVSHRSVLSVLSSVLCSL